MRKECLQNENIFLSFISTSHTLPSFTFYFLESVGKKSAPHRNPSIDLHFKSIAWFPYETNPKCKEFRKDIKPKKSLFK